MRNGAAGDLVKQPSNSSSRSRTAPAGKRLLSLVFFGVVLNVAVFFGRDWLLGAHEQRRPSLRIGGTSVTAFLIDNQWKDVFRKAKGIEIEYPSTGSTDGINKMIDGEFAIGFTHNRITDEQRQRAQDKGGEVVHVPVVVCAVVPIYNLPTLRGRRSPTTWPALRCRKS